MPKRIPKWLARQSREHPVMERLVLIVLIVTPGALVVNHQQNCSTSFAKAWYDAQTPRIAAQARVDEADNLKSEAEQKILTQKAGPDDYAALRHAIRERNRLWDELVAEQKDHPIPPPPSKFC